MNTNEPKADLYAIDLRNAEWRKSSFSAGEGQCVEITDLPGSGVAIRDSKNPETEPLRYTADEWNAFRKGIVDGTL